MAGHSKWNNIKNRKDAQDKRRSRDFFIVGKMIRVAVKNSNDGNPDTNPALRQAVEKARSVNMPKETVQRAINRALGVGENGLSIQETIYEGYGPHGAGFMVEVATDNVQRTASELRFIFSRHGGSLAGPGATAFLFARQGADFVTTIPLELTDEQGRQVQTCIDALEENEDVVGVTTNATWPSRDSEVNAD